MRATTDGFRCTKCDNVVSGHEVELKQIEHDEGQPIEVVEDVDSGSTRVNETCPLCGNSEAFRSTSFVSGEHAGVRQERSLQRYTCTKCGHAWTAD